MSEAGSTLRIASPAALDARVGEEIAVTDWTRIDQDRIDRFAEATGDHQWIHVDPIRAAKGPFGSTIAHGFLTLSLLPRLLDAVVAFEDIKLSVNYGLDKVRFPSPVPAGARIRVRVHLKSTAPLPDYQGTAGRHIVWHLTAEREGGAKPVCIAETVSRRHWGTTRMEGTDAERD
jgi:acyl dehydratase